MKVATLHPSRRKTPSRLKKRESLMGQEYINAFANALQLSVESPISKIAATISDDIEIIFERTPSKNSGWKYFCRIIPGDWNAETTTYVFSRHAISSSLITFLLLTRLQLQPMKKIAEIDAQYVPFVTALQLIPTAKSNGIATVQDIVRSIFQRIEQQHMTLREVAEQSGLSQVSISNFKAGRDIKLSSLLKIAKVVGLKLRLCSVEHSR